MAAVRSVAEAGRTKYRSIARRWQAKKP